MYYGKVRGQKRKLKMLLKNIEKIEPYQKIDEAYDNRFDHFHVPSNPWIEMPKTSSKIKTTFCEAWIRKTEEILKAKPESLEFCKVVCMLDIPYLYSSQIIVFYDQEYYESFWDRHDSYQEWSKLPDSKSLMRDRNIVTDLKEVGFKEIIRDEDYTCVSDLWFYGEVSEKQVGLKDVHEPENTAISDGTQRNQRYA